MTSSTWSTVEPMRSASSRGERLPGALLVIIIVAAALRAFWLTHQSLWTDEAVTYFSSVGSPADVVSQREVNSNIPPLYYLIVNLVLRLGAGDLILRLPSVVAGVLSIPVFFVVVRRWLGVTAGLWCAAGLAVSPFHVWYSQEARPYALLVLLSLVALWCLQHALAEPKRRAWRAAFVVSAAAVFATHTIGLAFVAFTAAVVLLAVPRSQWRDWLWTFVATGALMVPAIYRLVTFPPDAAASSTYTFHILHMPYAIWSFATGYSLGPSVAELHVVSRRTALVLGNAPVIVPVLSLFAALFIYAGFRLWRREPRLAGIVAAWFAFPMALAIMGPMMTVHPFNVRYAILAFPPFMMLIGLGVAELRWRPARAVACAAIAILSAVALYRYYFNPRYYRDDNRAGAHFIASHSTGHELVIVSAPFTAVNLRYYKPGYRARLLRYPPAEQERVDSASVGSDVGAMLGDEDRFWLFLSRTYDSDPHGYLEEYCEQHFRRGPSYVGAGVRVIRYEVEADTMPKGRR